jgi:hypothetical protein
VADQLLGELHATEVKTAQSNGHICALLKPENPPQSTTLKKHLVDDEKKAKVRGRKNGRTDKRSGTPASLQACPRLTSINLHH